MGSTVLGYDEIYKAYHPFVNSWKQQLVSGSAQPYILTVDITKAFNAIRIDKLLKLAADVLQSSDYLMIKYASVIPSPQCSSLTCVSGFSRPKMLFFQNNEKDNECG